MESPITRKRKSSLQEAAVAIDVESNDAQPPEKLLKVSENNDAYELDLISTNNGETSMLHTTEERSDADDTSANTSNSNENVSSETNSNDVKLEQITDNRDEVIADVVELNAVSKEIVSQYEEPACKTEVVTVDIMTVNNLTKTNEDASLNETKAVIKDETANENNANIMSDIDMNCNDESKEDTTNINSEDYLHDVVTIKFGSQYVSDILKEPIRNALMKIADIMMFERNDDFVIVPIDDSKTRKKKKRAEKKSIDSLFMVDTKPSINQENNKLQYNCKFSLEKPENKQKQQVTAVCFNCAKNHCLRDCPYPKDFVKINKAKTKITKAVRYHMEEEQKFHEFKPGRLSQKLKDALGLRNHELPTFIYRMREMGYPPGWVEEAFETNSELSLFDSEGKLLSNAKKGVTINPDKIIEYPGFNAPLDKYKDEYRLYGARKYCPLINKQSIIEVIKKFKDNHESCDMDIDEEEQCEAKKAVGQDNKRLSPTLNDLEEEKIKLLAQLNENESSNEKEDVTKESAAVKEIKLEMIENTDEKEESTGRNINNVRTSSFGTPILQRQHSYKTLPHPDNFSVNISPVINFENLPNATGKFEQMVELLQKVRATLSNKNNTNL